MRDQRPGGQPMSALRGLGSLVAAVLLLAWLLAPWPAPAGDEQADNGTLARLVARLGSEHFIEREQASAALEALGEQALEALRRVEAGSPDPEVRRRARLIIEVVE